MMLQKNGIEDFRPLDVTLEDEEYPSNNELQYQNGIDHASISDKSDENGGLDLQSMPEYKSETKADFNANQEAIDWIMKDPNDFNVKSYEDSSLLEDSDNFATNKDDKSETGNDINSLLNHKNYGSKRHHASSHNGVRYYSHDADDRLSPSDETSIKTQRHRQAETTQWNDNDNDHDNDFNSDELQDDYVNDGTDNGRYKDFNRDSDDNNSQETSMTNLKQRVRNQDANLFKELEDFQNVDDGGNFDESDNILGNVDEQHNEFGNTVDNSEKEDDREDESISHDENTISNTNERTDDESGNESESKHEQKDEDESETYSKTGDDKENGRVETNGNEMKDDDDYENSTIRGKAGEKDDTKGQRETTEAKDVATDQKNLGLKTKSISKSDKMQGIKDKTPGEINSHKEVDQRNNDTSLDESFARLEERITNEIKEFMSRNEPERSGGSNQVKEDKLDTNSESANNISKEGSKLGFPTAEIVGQLKSEKVGHVNRAPEQKQQTSVKSDKEHYYNKKHAARQEKVRTAFSNAGNDRYTDEPDPGAQVSKSSAHRTSTPRYHDHKGLVITTDEPLTSAQKPAIVNDKQQLFNHKEEQMMINDEQNPETLHTVGFKRPALVGKIRAQRHKEEIHDNHGNSERPTTTGFRRNQPMYGPSSTFSLADALKMQNIVSYLRGTTTHPSPPTASSSFGPNRFSLKSLYYYPVHPTPQGEPEDDSATKNLMFSEWNDWSTCSVTCGKGTSLRARICLVTSCSQKDLFQTKSCQRSICADDLERESLEEHNELRAKHFSPPLLWSHDLSSKAQAIAQRLATKDFLTLDDLQEPQGESLSQIQYTDEHLAKKAIDKWYSEIKSYSYSYPKISPKTRHFVQIVWKGTKEMGLAFAKSPHGNNTFVVALYNPPLIEGNGHLQQNVLRPGMKNDLYSTIKRKRRSAVKFS
ncbi:uncharacterized protein [Porites lutea]|uniref:uncharacterized protein n=1 Tax=Porites lutea TaxID=51062 RepID=UPI003CC5AE31